MNKIVTGLSLAVALVVVSFTPTAYAQPSRGTATAEAPNTLRAGPMVGDVDMHNASIWLLTERPGAVEVEFWPLAAGSLAAQGPANAATRRVQVQTDAQLAPGTAIARLTGLQAGQAYGYRVLVDGRQQEPSLSFRTHARWQFRQGVHAPEVRVMLSSCTYINESARDRDGTPYGGDYEIFGAMAQAKPDLTVWMGDNVYYRENDYTSAEGMAHRWRHDRALPELQPLLRTGRHVATWDDHDFGPNDSNSSFSLKGAALDIFKRQWANRSWGLPEAPGVFGNFMESDIEFFLLDGRYHRDSDRDKDNPDKTMLGSAQMRWLKNALLASCLTVAKGTPLSRRTRYQLRCTPRRSS
jgi:alkaline phosphatase D